MRRLCLALLALAACSGAHVKMLVTGEEHDLRERPPNAALKSRAQRPPVMVLALDGVGRDVLYDMIRRHQLPSFEALLGPEAYFNETLLSSMPSTTMPAWVTAMTGVGPGEHGVPGNEYFIRETQTLACPAPISFHDTKPTLEIYTEHYLDKLVEVPTVYERLREADPDVNIWVSMNHLFRGADKLLLPKRGILVKALANFVDVTADKPERSRKLFAALDESAIDAVVSRLSDERATPDVLTVYISGADLYAHVAKEEPDKARRDYLREIVDPALGKLVGKLRERRMLDQMWTLVIADHGHTQVLYDEKHALGEKAQPAVEVLTRAGFRVRPLARDVGENDPFSAVIAYGGTTAYVYLADRSQCAGQKDLCAWKLPPRYEEDVLPAAEAIYRANQEGPLANTLDLILTRRPKPFAEVDNPFEVYVGRGQTVGINDYLRDHPHPTYIAVAERLRALAVGAHGERAGDIMLITHAGDVARPEDRYYFAEKYRSWHGSPSRQDSEIPLIVSNRRYSRADVRTWVTRVLGNDPAISKVTDLILGMRAGAPGR